MTETLQDYDYLFPASAVAQRPLDEREASRMMVVSKASSVFEHANFRDLPNYLNAGDLVVVNDTQVMACRIFTRKPTGGKVEVFLLKPHEGLVWECFFSPARGLAEGVKLEVFSRSSGEGQGRYLEVTSLQSDEFRVSFSSLADQAAILEQFGEMPLPPYIERPIPVEEDKSRYQTVFASQSGAVAAPTAGLHFTDTMLQKLSAKGIALAKITLHVGAGTFLPVKTDDIEDHAMHAEWYRVPQETLRAIAATKERGGKVLAVGTTSLRALESWALSGDESGWTKLFVRPGFSFQVVDRLLTNFHQPKSTLLMLVSALAGREKILEAYREAIEQGYRLFSYGDCMLIRD